MEYGIIMVLTTYYLAIHMTNITETAHHMYNTYLKIT